MSYQWTNDYFGSIERYPFRILILGPGDGSNDARMLKKRKDVMNELGKIPIVHAQFFTAENVRNPEDWLRQVELYAMNEADYVLCLLTSTVSLFAEGVRILPDCRSKSIVFYNSTELRGNTDLNTIIQELRRQRITLYSMPSDRIDECHIVSSVMAIVYSYLQRRAWDDS